jgi:hypothetical protein
MHKKSTAHITQSLINGGKIIIPITTYQTDQTWAQTCTSIEINDYTLVNVRSEVSWYNFSQNHQPWLHKNNQLPFEFRRSKNEFNHRNQPRRTLQSHWNSDCTLQRASSSVCVRILVGFDSPCLLEVLSATPWLRCRWRRRKGKELASVES